MESKISKILNLNNGHCCLSSSELKLLEEYFTSNADSSSSADESSSSDDETSGDVTEPLNKRTRLVVPSPLLDVLSSTPPQSTSATVLESVSAGIIPPASNLCEQVAADDLSAEIKGFRCSCQFGLQNNPCYENFDFMQILQHKLSCLEIDFYNSESVNYLNEHLIAKIDALCCDSAKTQKSHNKNTERKRVKCNFLFHGQQVCQTTFLFIHNIGKKRWKNLMKRWHNTGVEIHTHGNCGKGSNGRSQLTAADITGIVTFIDNFASTHAMILPGRVPAFKDPNLKLLPSGLPKSKVHRLFLDAAKDSDVRLVSYRTFCRVWKEYRYNVRVQNPRTDLCSVCTANQIILGAMSKLSEEKQLKLLQTSSDHLIHANKEREEYKRQISESRANLDSSLKMGCHEPCSFDGCGHYSFDYAQQVHIPTSAEQVGALYFLTPY